MSKRITKAEMAGFEAGFNGQPNVPTGNDHDAWRDGWEEGKERFDRRELDKKYPGLSDMDFMVSSIQQALDEPRNARAQENAQIALRGLKGMTEALLMK